MFADAVSRGTKYAVIFTRVCNKVCKNSNENVSVEKHCYLWFSSIAVSYSCNTVCRPWYIVKTLKSLCSNKSTDVIVGLQYIWYGCYLTLQAYSEFSWSFAKRSHGILPLKKELSPEPLRCVEGAVVNLTVASGKCSSVSPENRVLHLKL